MCSLSPFLKLISRLCFLSCSLQPSIYIQILLQRVGGPSNIFWGHMGSEWAEGGRHLFVQSCIPPFNGLVHIAECMLKLVLQRPSKWWSEFKSQLCPCHRQITNCINENSIPLKTNGPCQVGGCSLLMVLSYLMGLQREQLPLSDQAVQILFAAILRKITSSETAMRSVDHSWWKTWAKPDYALLGAYFENLYLW